MLEEKEILSSFIGGKPISNRIDEESDASIGYVNTDTVKNIETSCVEPGQGFEQLDRIKNYLIENSNQIVNTLVEETGYTVSDAEMLLNAAIKFLENIREQYNRVFEDGFSIGAEKSGTGNIRTKVRPKGNILVITPGNATIPLAVILSASALVTGNTVTLKPSSQAAKTAYLVMKPFIEHFSDRFNLVYADSKQITSPEVLENFDAIHYTGSSRYYESVRKAADTAKIDSYIEGEGNGVLIVDGRPEDAAEAVVNALTRCNGMLCTTPSGIMVRKEVYHEFLDELKQRLQAVEIGSPEDEDTDLAADVRKNFDAEPLDGFECLEPVILKPVEGISQRELYGPGAWLDGWESQQELEEFLNSRSHGLNITVFTDSPEFFDHSKAMVSRYCFNIDPTLQSPFEPWGALGVSGDSPGNTFMEKFSRRTVEIRGE